MKIQRAGLMAMVLAIALAFMSSPVLADLTVELNDPSTGVYWTASDTAVQFNVTVTNNNDSCTIQNVSVYTDFNGTWQLNATTSTPTNATETTVSTFNFANTGWTEAAHIWNAFAEDNCSNSAWAAANFTGTVDRTAPVITAITYGRDDTKDTTNAVDTDGKVPIGDVYVTASVTETNTPTCKYSTTDEAYASMTDSFAVSGATSSFTVYDLGDATYTYYMTCQDAAGNEMAARNSTTFSVNRGNALVFGDGVSGGGVRIGGPAEVTSTPIDDIAARFNMSTKMFVMLTGALLIGYLWMKKK